MFARSKRLIVVFAVLVLFVLTAAAPQSAMAAVDGCRTSHKVVAGDYLYKIAVLYDVDYMQIATLNELKNPNLIFVGQVLCISTTETISVNTGGSDSSIKMYATAVVEDETVSLVGKLLTPNSRYQVYLSNYKQDPAIQYLAGEVKTDSSGAFTKTFSIPKRLIDVPLLRVVVKNTSGSSFTNWFINASGTAYIGGIGSPEVSVKVDSVQKDATVKIIVDNLPSNIRFKVYIQTGDKETGGEFVGSVFTSKGGKVSKTFNIPAAFAGKANLNVRVESTSVEMMDFTTFKNK